MLKPLMTALVCFSLIGQAAFAGDSLATVGAMGTFVDQRRALVKTERAQLDTLSLALASAHREHQFWEVILNVAGGAALTAPVAGSLIAFGQKVLGASDAASMRTIYIAGTAFVFAAVTLIAGGYRMQITDTEMGHLRRQIIEAHARLDMTLRTLDALQGQSPSAMVTFLSSEQRNTDRAQAELNGLEAELLNARRAGDLWQVTLNTGTTAIGVGGFTALVGTVMSIARVDGARVALSIAGALVATGILATSAGMYEIALTRDDVTRLAQAVDEARANLAGRQRAMDHLLDMEVAPN